jgi:hypothetical protein
VKEEEEGEGEGTSFGFLTQVYRRDTNKETVNNE